MSNGDREGEGRRGRERGRKRGKGREGPVSGIEGREPVGLQGSGARRQDSLGKR